MIVWLASYPRSGNTLLRTVLYKTMGLKSASDELGESRFTGATQALLDHTGMFEYAGSWNDYYQKVLESEEVFLVKTHRPPRDDQPAIYVVRDGRKALLSYSRFHQRFSPEPYPSFLNLVLGEDIYGDWTDHYRTWTTRANTLMVRYEELVNAKDVMLRALAEKVRYSGAIEPWHNPFDLLHHESPDFFREGETAWQSDPAWTTAIDAMFFHLHGGLMIELGYASPETVAAATSDICSEWLELVDASRSLLTEKKVLEKVCKERQAVINGLKVACDERLALIERQKRPRRVGQIFGFLK